MIGDICFPEHFMLDAPVGLYNVSFKLLKKTSGTMEVDNVEAKLICETDRDGRALVEYKYSHHLDVFILGVVVGLLLFWGVRRFMAVLNI